MHIKVFVHGNVELYIYMIVASSVVQKFPRVYIHLNLICVYTYIHVHIYIYIYICIYLFSMQGFTPTTVLFASPAAAAVSGSMATRQHALS